MTVQELIEELQKVEDKGLEVATRFGEFFELNYVNHVAVGEWEVEDESSKGKQRLVQISVYPQSSVSDAKQTAF